MTGGRDWQVDEAYRRLDCEVVVSINCRSVRLTSCRRGGEKTGSDDLIRLYENTNH